MNYAQRYFPILVAKAGEIDALGRLYGTDRYWIRPTLDFLLPSDEPAEQHLCRMVMEIARVWDSTLPLNLDLSRYAPEQVSASGTHVVEHLFKCAEQAHLTAIPTIGPLHVRGPDPRYVDTAADIARRLGRGIAIRIPNIDLINAKVFQSSLEALISRIKLPATDVDLYLDFGTFAKLNGGQNSEASLRSLLLEHLKSTGNSFRNLIIAGTSYPESSSKTARGKEVRVSRLEMALWNAIRDAGYDFVQFGDYGARFPSLLPNQGNVRVPARVNVATSDGIILSKNKDRNEYRTLCGQVCQRDEFESQAKSWGKSEIVGCYQGRVGKGRPQDWVARDMNMHLTSTLAAIEKVAGNFRHAASIPSAHLRLVSEQSELPAF